MQQSTCNIIDICNEVIPQHIPVKNLVDIIFEYAICNEHNIKLKCQNHDVDIKLYDIPHKNDIRVRLVSVDNFNKPTDSKFKLKKRVGIYTCTTLVDGRILTFIDEKVDTGYITYNGEPVYMVSNLNNNRYNISLKLGETKVDGYAVSSSYKYYTLELHCGILVCKIYNRAFKHIYTYVYDENNNKLSHEYSISNIIFSIDNITEEYVSIINESHITLVSADKFPIFEINKHEGLIYSQVDDYIYIIKDDDKFNIIKITSLLADLYRTIKNKDMRKTYRNGVRTYRFEYSKS